MKHGSLPAKQSRHESGAKRQAKYAASGRQIGCVLRDPDAIATLDRLIDQHGGVTRALTALLRTSSDSSSQNTQLHTI